MQSIASTILEFISYIDYPKNVSHSPEKTARIYAWMPRAEVVYIQAVIDAYDGLARLRTEKHDGEKSLILAMTSESRKHELLAALQQLEKEIDGRIELI